MGLFSGVIAVLGIIGGVNLLYDYWPELTSLMNPTNDLVLYVAMILSSIIISVISTWFAVARFLRLKTDKLYY
jgi:cell division transport system permease protein